jgi:opacity protein-like surface antigen
MSNRRATTVVLFLFLISTGPGSIHAQVPVAAGRGVPLPDVAVGYSHVNAGIAGNRVSMNGVDASFTEEILPRLSLQADLGYARTSNVFQSGPHADMLTYLVGPLFYALRERRLSGYGRGLIGGTRTSGAFAASTSGFNTGFANKLAWGVGGGMEYKLTRLFSVRVATDYLHSAFFDKTGGLRGQNNFRTTASIVYLFKTRSR